MSGARTRALAAAGAVATAVVGGLGTDPGSAWYRSLAKPPWQPPPLAFPLVWTPLYVLIGYGTGQMLETEPDPARRRRLAALVAADLAANAGWCWLFFKGRSPAGGLAGIVVLDALNVELLRQAARRDPKAAAALAPYLAPTLRDRAQRRHLEPQPIAPSRPLGPAHPARQDYAGGPTAQHDVHGRRRRPSRPRCRPGRRGLPQAFRDSFRDRSCSGRRRRGAGRYRLVTRADRVAADVAPESAGSRRLQGRPTQPRLCRVELLQQLMRLAPVDDHGPCRGRG